jgi:hypothetical protein
MKSGEDLVTLQKLVFLKPYKQNRIAPSIQPQARFEVFLCLSNGGIG